jgi:putative Holliday junction resolvase
MKYLGIDYGAKRIGVAVSDVDGTIAFPRGTLENDSHVVEHIARRVEGENAEVIVIGDTRSFSGLENPVTKESDEFAGRLKNATGLPVIRAWEAGSSIEASRYAPESQQHDDASAAAIILQRYLDMKK